MPHVVISDPPDPGAFHRAFEPWKRTTGAGARIAARAAYLRSDYQVVLVQAMAIELGPPTHFFVVLEPKKRWVTVKLFDYPSPARTAAVKEIVAQVARDYLEMGGHVERTNLTL